MSHAVISLLGLYNYDSTILDGLNLPEELDKDNVCDNLLMETAELEVLYPDPSVMKNMIRIWSSRKLPVWQELYNTTVLEYNPIWNKDATITETEDEDIFHKNENLETRDLAGSRNETRDLAGSRNETRDLAGSSDETKDLADSLSHSVFGYNSSAAAPASLDEGTDTGTDNISTTDTGTVDVDLTDTGTVDIDFTDTGTVSNKEKGKEFRDVSRERRETGNIGITSTQELIRQQRDVVEFNIIERIINDFKCQFCLLVY